MIVLPIGRSTGGIFTGITLTVGKYPELSTAVGILQSARAVASFLSAKTVKSSGQVISGGSISVSVHAKIGMYYIADAVVQLKRSEVAQHFKSDSATISLLCTTGLATGTN